MLITALVSWWYGAGWIKQLLIAKQKIGAAVQAFSLFDLLRTLFSPYRQIAAGGVRGPIGVKLRAWFDRLVSRFVGFFVRTIVIAIGLVYLLLQSIFALLRILIWPLLPLLPVIGVFLWLGGVK